MLKIREELNNIFEIVLKVPPKKSKINLNYKNVKKWDSLNHVKLILVLEVPILGGLEKLVFTKIIIHLILHHILIQLRITFRQMKE
mgnify:CR=1 FL=1